MSLAHFLVDLARDNRKVNVVVTTSLDKLSDEERFEAKVIVIVDPEVRFRARIEKNTLSSLKGIVQL